MPSISRKEKLRREALYPEVEQKYLSGEIEVEQITAPPYNIPEASFFWRLKKDGLSRKDEKKKTEKVLKEVAAAVQENQSKQAVKLSTIAYTIGATITDGWLPLIDAEMADGKGLENLAREIMQWYENKTDTQLTSDNKEKEILALRQELQFAYAAAAPNFRYKLRIDTYNRYAKDLLLLRAVGRKVPLKPIMKALWIDLGRLEGDLTPFLKGVSENVN